MAAKLWELEDITGVLPILEIQTHVQNGHASRATFEAHLHLLAASRGCMPEAGSAGQVLVGRKERDLSKKAEPTWLEYQPGGPKGNGSLLERVMQRCVLCDRRSAKRLCFLPVLDRSQASLEEH